MTVPFARSYPELQVYLDGHPCECGSVDYAWKERQSVQGERKLVEIRGRCRACHRKRSFAFTMPVPLMPLRVGAFSELDRPSELLDPGEWLRVADHFGGPHAQYLADPATMEQDTGEERDRALDLARTVGAVEEILLFIPPGAGTVPGDAFRTEFGRQVHAAEPERFTRDALELARDLCRAAAGPFDFDEGLGWPRRDARSVREARMWVRQQRCVCGANRFEPTEKLDPPEPPEPAARLDIEGDCPVCGDRRLYQFTVPDRPARRPSGPMGYGLHYEGDGPSVLFDPGQFLALGLLFGRLADQAVAEQPADFWREALRWEAAFELFAGAVAGYDEALLFVPPGADRVPAERIRTAAGRLLLHESPDAYRRDRIAVQRDERQRALDAFVAAHPEPEDGWD